MKILYVTTVGITMGFFKELIKELMEDGHTVDIATNETEYQVPDFYRELNCKIYPLDCSRSPFDKGNIVAIKQIKQLVEKNQYDIVHCHTPIAAMCTRIACRKIRKRGTKVFYTAHGFHFYNGAPLKNWLIYYPAEWICAFYTDVLVTINTEDYNRAQKHMHAKQIEYVPGVGIDVEKFANIKVDRLEKRKELGIPKDAFLLLSVGELNENKNHQIVIRALAEIEKDDIHYVVAGEGSLRNYLNDLAVSLGVSDRLHLLGFRDDVAELYKVADLFIHPSYREGLPVAVLEATASGIPTIVSCVRGCRDIEKENLFCPSEVKSLINKLEKYRNNNGLDFLFSSENINYRMEILYENSSCT